MPAQAQPQSPFERTESQAPDTTLAAEALKFASVEADSLEDMPINNEARKTNLYKMSTKDEILPFYGIGERVILMKTI